MPVIERDVVLQGVRENIREKMFILCFARGLPL